MLAWIVYSLLISSLIAVAARLAEHGFRAQGWSTRWLWVSALGTSIVIPALAYLAPHASAVGTGRIGTIELAPVVGLHQLTSSAQAAPLGIDLELAGTVVVVLWAMATALLFIRCSTAYMRLRAERRGWTPRQLEGQSIFVSDSLGPAVSGFWRGAIVLPRWALKLDEELQRLILLHEREHLREGDHRIVVLATLVLAVLPWNLPLWYQVARTRLAIELDCDRRVLGRGVNAQAYGELLVEVAHRSSRPRLASLALVPSRSAIEERVRRIFAPRQRNSWVRAMLTSCLALLFLALACETPSPDEVDGDESSPEVSTTRATKQAPEPTPDKPVFTPYTQGPELLNRAHAADAVADHYPQLLKQAGIGGRVELWVFIDKDGRVKATTVKSSSGRAALDEAAEAAVREFVFRPAEQDGEPVAVWIGLPVIFSARE